MFCELDSTVSRVSNNHHVCFMEVVLGLGEEQGRRIVKPYDLGVSHLQRTYMGMRMLSVHFPVCTFRFPRE